MILDCTHLHHRVSNETMELLCKSVEEAGLWHPHPTDRLLSAMEEESTTWMSQALNTIQVVAMLAFGIGVAGQVRKMFKKAASDDLGPKCRQLEHKIANVQPGTLSMQDYLEVLDCWLWRYLPPAVSAHQANRQAMQQYLAGLARRTDQPKSLDHARDVITKLPTTFEGARKQIPSFNALDEARIAVAQASAARHIQALTSRTRSALQDLIINAERRRLASGADRYDLRPLEQQLRDSFGELNRDWRRVAVTETAINASEAYLSRFQPGESVKWLAHPGACHYCESQNGKVFTVVAPDHPRKDPDTMVWTGKHAENIGRSIAKRKRLESGELVDRDPEELLVPAIPAHPTCRCTWSPVSSTRSVS